MLITPDNGKRENLEEKRLSHHRQLRNDECLPSRRTVMDKKPLPMRNSQRRGQLRRFNQTIWEMQLLYQF